MSKTLKQRNEIPQEYKWNIEDMYGSDELWEKDIEESVASALEYEKYQGKLAESADTLYSALKERNDIWQKVEKAYVYSRMRRDEDNRVEKYQAMCDKSQAAISKISAAMSFFVPELLAGDSSVLLGYINEKEELKEFDFMIKDILREKDHILSKEEENVLAQMSELSSTTNNIFTMLNNADIKFGTITDENGQEVTLTHGNYISFLECHDRGVRQQAYEAMYTAYKNLINTISTTYNYNTKHDVVSARIRKYSSSRAAALSGDNISEEVYDNLVKVVNENLPAVHKYMEIRKKLLGVDELKMHDVYVPLVKLPKNEISFEEARQIIAEGLAPLGDHYIEDMNKGLDAGWVDVYENEGKTSGAYSFGSYDSMPYILMNYSSSLKDVFTLVHEMGHSMHSFYTRKTQPYTYGDHSIFTAEVASTVNENLLMKHLIAKETDPEMKKYLINYHIEEFRTTLFRQTMFAEFEHWTHKCIEDGETLTAQSMCDYYYELNKKYFGPAMADDEWIKYEWSRIPHFYNAFYVYKYATGYSAAAAISDIILEKGPEDYLKFLSTGSSDYPIELLKIAGVDMSTKEPIERAMEVFKNLVDEFEKLV
ncbi:MAG: oligoendopeptidase F [Eubacterium sp.]|nr:oligoendopeptidase F [Eubacterium sp.]